MITGLIRGLKDYALIGTGCALISVGSYFYVTNDMKIREIERGVMVRAENDLHENYHDNSNLGGIVGLAGVCFLGRGLLNRI
ncbi:hypothetical protein HOD75_05185 [archaeon]|mgnify:FL=1|jgi:hypothetical protein|nr:hypothetical protein [archaeon]MBT4242255.1 hypothetical protein [archaeon]MBT4417943.1 hypothetical protein [archaeon]